MTYIILMRNTKPTLTFCKLVVACSNGVRAVKNISVILPTINCNSEKYQKSLLP